MIVCPTSYRAANCSYTLSSFAVRCSTSFSRSLCAPRSFSQLELVQSPSQYRGRQTLAFLFRALHTAEFPHSLHDKGSIVRWRILNGTPSQYTAGVPINSTSPRCLSFQIVQVKLLWVCLFVTHTQLTLFPVFWNAAECHAHQ